MSYDSYDFGGDFSSTRESLDRKVDELLYGKTLATLMRWKKSLVDKITCK